MIVREHETGNQPKTILRNMRRPRMVKFSSLQPLSRTLVLALLPALTIVAFSPVLSADFISLDDHSHLFDNPHLRRMSTAGLEALWTKSYFNLYIPITYSVWWAITMIVAQFGPLREHAWVFHFLNLAVHLANASLLFLLLRNLLRLRSSEAVPNGKSIDTIVALLSAAFFALHPVQVESVAWISELKGELSTLFGLMGLCLYYCTGKRILPAFCFLAAMLSKPSAIVLPGIVLLIDRLLLHRSFIRSTITAALLGVLLLPLVLVTKRLQPDLNLDFIPTVAQKFCVAADALTFYVCKVLSPTSLAVDYGRSPRYVLDHVSSWQLALSLVFSTMGVAAILLALVRPLPSAKQGEWTSLLTCGWAIFTLSLAPVLGMFSFGFQEFSTVADHYLYVPLIGASMVFAAALIRLHRFAVSRYLAAAVILALAGSSFQQAELWRSTETLFSHTVEVNPQSYLGYFCIGDAAIKSGHLEQSILPLSKALAINPNYQNAQVALGLALAQTGDSAKAIDFYSSVLAQNPSSVGSRARLVSSLHNNLGMLLMQAGREDESIEHFRKAVAIFPQSFNGHLNLGNAALANGQYLDAIGEYEIAQSISPGNPMVETRLARARQSAQHATAKVSARPTSP